jgi:hypothetical protein
MNSVRLMSLAPLALFSLAACGGAVEDEPTGTSSSAVTLDTTAVKDPVPPVGTVEHPVITKIPPHIEIVCSLPLDTIASGTIIDTAIPGVTFTAVEPMNGGWVATPNAHVYAVAAPYPSTGTTDPIGVSLFPPTGGVFPGMFQAVDGAIEITFATPVTTFSAAAEVVYTGTPGLLPPLNLPFVDSWGPSSSGSQPLGQVTETVGSAGIGGFNEWTTTNAAGPNIGTVILGVGSSYDTGVANVLFASLACTY